MTHDHRDFEFDISEVPFSFRGSWFNVSSVTGLHERAENLHLVSHINGIHSILEFVPEVAAEREPTIIEASPSVLRIANDLRLVELSYESPEALRIRGSGLGLYFRDAAKSLTPFTGTYLFQDPGARSVTFTSYETGRRFRLTILSGSFEIVGAEALGLAERGVRLDADQDWEVVIESFETARSPYELSLSFDQIAADAKQSFNSYRRALYPFDRTHTTDTAAYVLWSATVAPSGFLARESILMSKHWMDKVWSWDHCFNALALAPANLPTALDQFLIPFDHADSTGALPDSVTQSEVLYNFVKPPIHGWAFAQLRARSDVTLDLDQLTEVYDAMSRWTQFWLEHRRVPGHVLPYYQHGNDSGWDNSTTFDRDRLIESPDLAAFLIVQLDVLADLSIELGIHEPSWSLIAKEIEDALMTELWNGETFIARSAQSGAESTDTSLLNSLPIVLGDRLPAEVIGKLETSIRAHLTEWGLATELLTSHHYEADGYWRGPIWAPSTLIIEDGARRAGLTSLADTISARFRAVCERSGFAENFDAITGDGLRDRAYTWTASTYLILATANAERH